MEIGYKYCLFSTKEKHDTMTTDQKCTKTNGRKDEKKRSEKDLMKGSVKVKKKKKIHYQLWIMALPAIIYFLVFCYGPMYGIIIAFKEFSAAKGIWGSPWVGLQQFERFFNSYQSWRLIGNTLAISLLSLIFCFPFPILLAMLLNQVRNKKFKKAVQTISYAPHFISIVVLCGMIILFLSPTSGFINAIIKGLGFPAVNFMAKKEWYRAIYVITDIWQNMGWNAVIYIAALAAVDPSLYEAARIDGAGKLQLIRYIDFPSILPTAVILLIMNVGSIMNVGFQKAFLLQNDLNISVSEIISTYTYKIGLVQADYSYSTAIGLFNTVVNIILLVTVNQIAKRLTKTSLW